MAANIGGHPDKLDRPDSFEGIVRPPVQEDIPQIRQLLQKWVLNQTTRMIDTEQITAIETNIVESIGRTGKESAYRVAVEHNKIIGIMGYRNFDRMPPRIKDIVKKHNPGVEGAPRAVELVNVFADPNHIGRGIGAKLLKEMQNLAKSNNFTEMYVESPEYREETSWAFYDRYFGEAVEQTEQSRTGKRAKVWRKDLSTL